MPCPFAPLLALISGGLPLAFYLQTKLSKFKKEKIKNIFSEQVRDVFKAGNTQTNNLYSLSVPLKNAQLAGFEIYVPTAPAFRKSKAFLCQQLAPQSGQGAELLIFEQKTNQDLALQVSKQLLKFPLTRAVLKDGSLTLAFAEPTLPAQQELNEILQQFSGE